MIVCLTIAITCCIVGSDIPWFLLVQHGAYIWYDNLCFLIHRSYLICPNNWCGNWHCWKKQWAIPRSCHYCRRTGRWNMFLCISFSFFIIGFFLFPIVLYSSYGLGMLLFSHRLPGALILLLEDSVSKNKQL